MRGRMMATVGSFFFSPGPQSYRMAKGKKKHGDTTSLKSDDRLSPRIPGPEQCELKPSVATRSHGSNSSEKQATGKGMGGS